MPEVTIRDVVIWMKHIHGDVALRDHLSKMSAEREVELVVNGVKGHWRKMADGKDGRPTTGLTPQGRMQTFWRELYAARRGESVSIELPRSDGAPLCGVGLAHDAWFLEWTGRPKLDSGGGGSARASYATGLVVRRSHGDAGSALRMMTADTNVLVYVQDDHDATKQATAASVMTELFRRNSPIALQCVGEFQNVLRRKLQVPAWLAAQEARNLLVSAPTFAATERAALEALSAVAAGRAGYWDTLLVHSAADAGCTVVFTEDRQGATRVGGVELVSPFDPDGGISERARELLELS